MESKLYSPEAERAVLSAALIDPSAIEDVAELRAQDFGETRHQDIADAMLHLHGAGTPIDMRTLQARLEESGAIDRVGGVAYLAGLDLDLPDLGSLVTYIGIVRDRAYKRRLREAGIRLAREVSEGDRPAEEIGQEHLDEVENASTELSSTGEAREACSVGEDVIRELENPDGAVAGIKSGLPDLDALTLGFEPGQLWVIAARPGKGKSALAHNIVINAGRSSKRSLIVSMEMGERQIQRRILSTMSGVPNERLRTRRLWPGDLDKVKAANQELEGYAAWIYDEPRRGSASELLTLARKHKRRHGLDMLLIDYLQLMLSDGKYERRDLEVAAITRDLKRAAGKIGIPIVLLAQLNREVDKRPGGRPILSDLRESGAIEADADGVIFIWQPEKDRPEILELDVAKNREGSPGGARVYFRGKTLRFESYVNMPGDYREHAA